MTFDILHLNIERSKHLDSVIKLLEDKKPHVVCLAEAMHRDVEHIASVLKYEFVYAPLILLKDDLKSDYLGVSDHKAFYATLKI